MFETVFKNRKLNISKLSAFGFDKCDNGYVKSFLLADGTMTLTVNAACDGTLYTEVTDNSSGEEYVLHRVSGAVGTFVGQVRSEYEDILNEISLKCFDADVFKSGTSTAVISYVRDTYGDELEFLWDKFSGNAVFRRKDTKKWYAAILRVSRRKLGLDSDEVIEILDLRIKPEDMAGTVDNIKYFPGYHMNKKHWITVCLDDSVPIDEICRRIDESYLLAVK